MTNSSNEAEATLVPRTQDFQTVPTLPKLVHVSVEEMGAR
jgi:hypothetical protein